MKTYSMLDASRKLDQEVTVMGWVRTRRDLGKMVFLDLWDHSGILQSLARPKSLDEESKKSLAEIRQGFCVEISGIINKRPEGQAKTDLATGGVELFVKSVKILNVSKPLPFDLDDTAAVNEDVRLKYRYLDLRAQRMMDNVKLRSETTKAFRTFLHNYGFTEVETPCLTKGTPEGSREYFVPSRLHEGKSYVLPQSPQQFKQLLMVAGVERYYQIARCFRDEDQRRDRQAEFTQLDMEMSFVEQEDILNTVEAMMLVVLGHLYSRGIPSSIDEKYLSLPTENDKGYGTILPFPRMTYKEAMEKYGTDKPDLRKDKNNPDELAFVWITDFPMFEKGDDGSIQSAHHPFTAPHDEDVALLDTNPLNVRAKAYDLVLNGAELVSGSIRIHQRDVQNKVFKILGLSDEDIQKRFGHMLEAFEYGAPPHGGCALGLDRFLMILANEPSIREVIAFPKTGDARDLMMGAPSEL